MLSLPKVSVVIPVFNEAKRIKKCLSSIQYQNYPRKNVEILVIDDNSDDETVKIAKTFGAKIFLNGTHNIERGKSIGLEKSQGKYIFFIDADNVLLDKNWFIKSIKLLEENEEIVGIQSQRFKYKPKDNIANRYCELFGVNDPMVFYLGKRGLLTQSENSWIYPDTLVSSNKDFFIVKFNTENLPTLGSQGYMTRKNLLLTTKWKPYLFHLDSIYDLVAKKKQLFAIIRSDIEHDYVDSLSQSIKKLQRNITLYLKFNQRRRYKYKVSKMHFLLTIFIMSSFILPLTTSIKGFIKKRDIAWFWHPIFCFLVVILYSYEVLKFHVVSYLKKIYHQKNNLSNA